MCPENTCAGKKCARKKLLADHACREQACKEQMCRNHVFREQVLEIKLAGNKRIPQPEMGDKGRCQSSISFWQASLGKEVQDIKNNSRNKYARNKRAGNNRTVGDG